MSTLIKTSYWFHQTHWKAHFHYFGHPMAKKNMGFESALSAYIYKERPTTKLHLKGEEMSVLLVDMGPELCTIFTCV